MLILIRRLFLLFGVIAFVSFVARLTLVSDAASWIANTVPLWFGAMSYMELGITEVLGTFRHYTYPIFDQALGWAGFALPDIWKDVSIVYLVALSRALPPQISYIFAGAETRKKLRALLAKPVPRDPDAPRIKEDRISYNAKGAARTLLRRLSKPTLDMARPFGGPAIYALVYVIRVLLLMTLVLGLDVIYRLAITS